MAKQKKKASYEDERKAWVSAYRKVWGMIKANKLEMKPCQECGAESVRFIMVNRNVKMLNIRFFCQKHYNFATGKGVVLPE